VTVEPTTLTSHFARVEDAIEDIRQGKMVVVVDAPDRENEGDLTVAAECATPDAINFMVMHGRGVPCLSLTAERCDELRLRPLASSNESRHGTAYTVPIDGRGSQPASRRPIAPIRSVSRSTRARARTTSWKAVMSCR
jgi:3,4-dihydroxy-2-butanone 4-phosphate synthase